MAFNFNDMAKILFNKIVGGKSYTNKNLSFDEEIYKSNNQILFENVWIDEIPADNPLENHTQYANGALYPTSDPIIKKWHKVQLKPVTTSKTNMSFRFGDTFKDIIPSEYGNGKYQWELWKKDITHSYNVKIPFGLNSWYFDKDSGILTFLGDSLPTGIDNDTNLPAITAYQYIGRKGSTSILAGANSASNVDNVTIELNGDDKIAIKDKYKSASYYTANLSGTASEVKATWTITHNLASKKVDVTVYENSSGEIVMVPITVKNNSEVELNFNPTVQSDAYSVLVEASY